MKPLFLDIRHLQMIATLAETQRVTDAAEKLGITPSAFSHRIREAERRLDIQLYDRSNKRLRMTPAAEYLVQVANRLLDDLARAEEDVRRMGQGVQHTVRLAIEYYSSYHWLPAFLQHLDGAMLDVGVQVVASAARNPIESLVDRSVDIAIVSGENARSGSNLVHLFDDELLFIMPPDHRLAGNSFITGEDIVGEDFITYTRIPEPDREYARLFQPNKTYPNWKETVELPEAIVEMVAAGLGTSVLAGWAVDTALRNGRVVGARTGEGGIQIPWYAATRSIDAEETNNAKVANILADWCATHGGFYIEEEKRT